MYGDPTPRMVAALHALGVPGPAAYAVAAAYPSGAGLQSATAEEIAAAAGKRGAPRWAARVVAAFSLGQIARECRDAAPETIAMPRDLVAVVAPRIADAETEQFAVVLLNSRQRVLGVHVVHSGTVASVEVHPREVFAPAVRAGAHSVAVSHNHPSGDPEPSAADIQLTARLVDCGRTLGIPLVDHVVLTAAGGFVSMAHRGLI